MCWLTTHGHIGVLTRALYNPCCRHVAFLGPSCQLFKTVGNRLARLGQMDKLQKTLIVPLSEVSRATENEARSAVNYDGTIIPTKPTSFPRNHGVIIGGVKMIYDPTLYSAFGFKRDEREHDPDFAPWLVTEWSHTRRTDSCSSSSAPTTINAVRYRENLDRTQWGHCSSDHVHARETESDDTGETSQHNTTATQTLSLQHQPQTTIPRNRLGQRIDPPIEFEKTLRAKMQKEGWCSNHHLKDFCAVQDCRFRHGSLDDNGKTALLSLTLGNFCRNGNGCEEPACYAGHHCPYEPCNKENNCHFPLEMHVADKRVVNVEGLMSPSSRRRSSDEKRRLREGKG